MRIEAVPFLFGFVGIDGGADHCVGPGDYWKPALKSAPLSIQTKSNKWNSLDPHQHQVKQTSPFHKRCTMYFKTFIFLTHCSTPL